MKTLKASELVKILNDKIKKDGDLPITLPDDPIAYLDEERVGNHEIACVGANTWIGKDDKPRTIMLMDPGAADALL